MKAAVFASLLCLVVVLGNFKISNAGELQLKFYQNSCQSAEAIAKNITWTAVSSNPSLAAKLLRLHYHDCFVRGCDASILLDPTSTNSSPEKVAPPNRNIAGYEVIDQIKAKLEETCPGIVSCADIVALAARDAVSFQFKADIWPVFTGRRDGTVSLSSEASANLPSANANFTTLLTQFQGFGLDISDLVALSGAHTIGVTHCTVISRRLFNFTGVGDTDPTLDPDYAATLKTICPLPANPSTLVDMDPGSALKFDTGYFAAVKGNKGIFRSDAALLTDPRSAKIVTNFGKQPVFFAQFSQSMKKMGAIGVLTGVEGEIRKNCRLVN